MLKEILILLCGSIMVLGHYELRQMKIGAWLSGAAYCGKSNYKKMVLGGDATGFKVADVLYDVGTDLEGYTGVIEGEKMIYVVYRGSSSTLNWMADAEVNKVDYKSYPECGCKVHNGFYRSTQNIVNMTRMSVKMLKTKYPRYSLMVTGHSYGAAVSQMIGMELMRDGEKPIVYNYGQPRTGEKKYGDFVNTVLIEYKRVTHNKDIVPHVPPIEEMEYMHSCGEVYENVDGVLKECSEVNCEDPSCADQYSLKETNGDDHGYYMGHEMSCKASTV